MTSIDTHVALLKQQREEYQNKTSNFMLDPVFNVLERVFKPDVDTSALAIVTQVDDLTTALAGQSQQLAELQQAVLILAQTTKNVEGDIDIIKKQTAPVVRKWADIRKEITALWNELISETSYFNHDATAVAISKGLTSIFQFGLAAPQQIHAQKRECHNHAKQMRSLMKRIEDLDCYATRLYPDDLRTLRNSLPVFTVGKKVWTVRQAMSEQFPDQLRTALLALRGI